jgi:hypothetical protein
VEAAVGLRTTNPATCPCAIELKLVEQVSGDESPVTFVTLGAGADEFGNAATTVPLSWVHEATDDDVTSYAVQVRRRDANNPGIVVSGPISVSYVPFDAAP